MWGSGMSPEVSTGPLGLSMSPRTQHIPLVGGRLQKVRYRQTHHAEREFGYIVYFVGSEGRMGKERKREKERETKERERESTCLSLSRKGDWEWVGLIS